MGYPEPVGDIIRRMVAVSTDNQALAKIDAAIEGRCACGCGVMLDPTGPSAWFASEVCQWRWQAAGRGQPPLIVDMAAVEAGLRRLGAMLGEVVTGVLPIIEAMARQFAAAAEQVRPLLPEQPPQDPMERALWARRNRNTGPRALPRAPRQINPSGTHR